jgi:hypothetical protein
MWNGVVDVIVGSVIAVSVVGSKLDGSNTVALRHQLGEVLKQLAMQRESRIDEGHLMRDHMHMLVSIPPKYSVSKLHGTEDFW